LAKNIVARYIVLVSIVMDDLLRTWKSYE